MHSIHEPVSGTGAKVPAGQDSHVEEFISANWPPTQVTHCDLSSLLSFPLGHVVHAVDAVFAAYFPPGHSVHHETALVVLL